MAFFSHDFSKKNEPSHPFLITVKSPLKATNLEVKVFPWTSVSVISDCNFLNLPLKISKDLKRKIEKLWSIPSTRQRLFLHNQELTRNNHSLDLYLSPPSSTLYLTLKPNFDNPQMTLKIYETFSDLSSHFDPILSAVRQGLNAGFTPKLTDDGTSGSYFLYDQIGLPLALFKPMDEEPFAPNNPRGYQGKLNDPGFRKGVLSGESAEREVAAYLLDIVGYYSVPMTAYVELLGFRSAGSLKRGSLQNFVSPSESAGNFGSGVFPTQEVHKIGILDLRILNCDRNENNILVQKKNKNSINIVPIDHGLCLPDCVEIFDYEIVWMGWPQSHEPFSSAELEHILNIDVMKDLKLLRSRLNIREKCLKNFVAANILLKQAAFLGFTLYQIGTMFYRLNEEEPSLLQRLIEKAKSLNKRMNSLFDSANSNGITEEEVRLERMSTTEDQLEIPVEKGLVLEKKASCIKRRASDPKFSETILCEEKKRKKRKIMEKKQGCYEGFIRYFEGLAVRELEKVQGKTRSRYFSSEFL